LLPVRRGLIQLHWNAADDPPVASLHGSKPAVLFNGNQPGLGKSVLAQSIAILREGKPVETASYNPSDEEFAKRLGSIVRRGIPSIIIDNANAHGSSTIRIDLIMDPLGHHHSPLR
jgi:hypothetical protein